MLAHKIKARLFLEVGRGTAEIRQFLSSGLHRETRVQVDGYFTNMR
jgi:hypothetical protein